MGSAPLLHTPDVLNPLEIIRIIGSPQSLTLCLACLLARGGAAKLLAVDVTGIGGK